MSLDELFFIGHDGRDYATIEGLRQAEEARKREHFPYMGDDGRYYSTFEELQAANEARFRINHKYIVHDAEVGKREIAPGTGRVQVCVGHLIERDETGRRRDVPVYRTETF